MELELEVASRGEISIIRCRGRLTYGPEAEELTRAARQALEASKKILLQMAGVTQIDSGGVGALGAVFIAAHNRDGEIKLSALHPRVAEVLRITGLDLLFDIRKSEAEAITAFERNERPAALGVEGLIKSA